MGRKGSPSKKKSHPRPIDVSVRVYGAGIMSTHLLSLLQEVEGVRLAKDIECIHRMRVASRRLRSTLDLFTAAFPPKKYRQWLKHVREVTRALGQARDMDVQIELVTKFEKKLSDPIYKPGVQRLVLRLSQQRAQLQEQVLAAMTDFETSGVAVDMQAVLTSILAQSGGVYLYSPAVYQRAFEAISACLDAFLAYEQFIYQPERVAELHAMRIAAKRLRYTMEAFAPLYENELKDPLQAIRACQEVLGTIHDCDVWINFLPGFIVEEEQRVRAYFGYAYPMKRITPGLANFQQDRQQTRQKEYQAFLTYWEELKAKDTWMNLLRTIQMPFMLSEAPG
jgi:CHAD domain-containing protein